MYLGNKSVNEKLESFRGKLNVRVDRCFSTATYITIISNVTSRALGNSERRCTISIE
jgi:hypothetical protein